MSESLLIDFSELPTTLSERATLTWQQFEEACTLEQKASLIASLKRKYYAENIPIIWVGSTYFSEKCIANPDLFIELINSGELEKTYDDDSFLCRLQQQCTEIDSLEILHRELRQFRVREICRIIWRDLTRSAKTEETIRDMSLMAEAAISVAYDTIYPMMVEKFGTPLGKRSQQPQHLVVLGMGKLGAYELNLSSDIDLIFSYPESGETDHPNKPLSNQQFFIHLAQALIRAIDKSIGGDFVFRVDMRLRPYGESGALVLSFNAMEEYYQSQGRDWERYAMVKARVIKGEKSQSDKLMAMLRPFIYRRYIDFSVIESLRDMKAMIERQVQRKGMDNNIKLGSGGIREIEFIAQCFQLIRGGRELELQQRSLLKILALLGNKGILQQEMVSELKEAYLYLRDVEHALQAYKDQQTQDLPLDTEGQCRLAWVMGFNSWEEFSCHLAVYRDSVYRHFKIVIEESPDSQVSTKEKSVWSELWLSIDDLSASAWRFEQQGFDDAEVVVYKLKESYRSICARVGQAESRDRIDIFMPRLLEESSQVENSGETLSRLLRFVDSVIRRTSYLVLLNENPSALKKLVMLFSVSPWISDQITHYPVLLDELLKAGFFELPPEKQELRRELTEELLSVPEDDDERVMEVLRYFKMSHVLHVAASEQSGRLSLMKVSDYLTRIAEVILEAVIQIAWHQMVRKYGQPQIKNEQGELVPINEPDFAIIGYGKMGGIELGYSSDLDLVFIGGSGNQMTDGGTSVPNTVFYLRLAQRVIHTLHARTALGQLYEVDMRLRPSGDKGELVSSPAAYQKYMKEDAWVWEQQALVRARFISGSSVLRTEFEETRQAVLARKRDLPALRQEVEEMRNKMVAHLGTQSTKNSESEVFHLKQDPGGIVDIEFMVQYAVLAWAYKYPLLVQYSDNIRILEALRLTGLFTEKESDDLSEVYRQYRSMGHRLALQQKTNTIPAIEFDKSRCLVRNMWQKFFHEKVLKTPLK